MTVAILQARMGSTRLPGKVLREVHGKKVLEHLIDRLTPSQKVDQFVVATTSNSEDDAIEEWCKEKGVHCYRGSDWDVLDRFWVAANSLDSKPDTIVRICCDNPLHTYKVIDFVVSEFEKAGTQYFSNSNQEPDYLEDGFDVEVFTYQALQEAQEKATLMRTRACLSVHQKTFLLCMEKS